VLILTQLARTANGYFAGAAHGFAVVDVLVVERRERVREA